jgi:hypothetical protein
MKEYKGRIVTISDYMLKGWALASNDLEKPVRVELQVDGEAPLEVLADHLSSTLRDRLGSSGNHFFRVPVAMPHLLQGRTITAKIAGTDFFLSNSPFLVDDERLSEVDESGLSYFQVIAEDEGAGTPLKFKHKAIHSARLSTLLFIAKPMSVASGAVLAELAKGWMREDSSALSSKNLFVVQYAPSPDDSVVDTISRMDADNRKILNGFQNLVFIDPQDKLPFAMRASSSSSRLFVVLSPGAALQGEKTDRIDALVAPIGFETRDRELPRVIRYDPGLGSTFSAARAIKRVIREAQPRQINAFAQVYGPRGRYDLPWTLSQRYDAVVVAEQSKWHDPAFPSFSQYMWNFASRVKALYASEDFLLRYRSLIDQLDDNPARLGPLLLCALEDGSRIDVRD